MKNNIINNTTKSQSNKTFRLALLGLLTAIIILQNFVPFFGYIPFQPFNPTIIHITVIIGAITMGFVEGAILGAVWGVICLIRAFVWPTTPLDPMIFTNPIISVLPRILVGLFAGLVYMALKKNRLNDVVKIGLSAIVGSFTNTILVLGFIYLFKGETYANYFEMDYSQLLPAMIAVVFTNGVVEAIAAVLLTIVIVKPLQVAYAKLRQSKA